MRIFILFLVTMLYSSLLYSQNSFKAIIQDEKTKHVIKGAFTVIQGSESWRATDSLGFVSFAGIPSGKQVFVITHPGYEICLETVIFPYPQTKPLIIFMHQASH